MTEFPLEPCVENRKSYYGRARVIRREGLTFLRSYATDVACVTSDGKLHRLWDGWSATTGRHLVEFARQYARESPLPFKRVWDRMKIESEEEARTGFSAGTRRMLLSPEAKA